MKKLLFVVIVIGILCYLGVLSFNEDKAKSVAKKGFNKGVELTKKGATAVGQELQKSAQNRQ